MTITQRSQIYSFHTLNFNFGDFFSKRFYQYSPYKLKHSCQRGSQVPGCFPKGIYFGTKFSNVTSRFNCKLDRMDRRQRAVSNWSVLLLFRHALLAASNCRVVTVPSPYRVGSRNLVIIIDTPIFSSGALGGRDSEL
jgi:hypothetical protein